MTETPADTPPVAPGEIQPLLLVAGGTAPLPTWKRGMDLALCLACLPLLLAVLLLAWATLSLRSPGPIIYRQPRVGLHGRKFTLYKVRTMAAGASEGEHERHVKHLMQMGSPMQKLDTRGDGRLVRGFHLLRASGLDELPQLFNVLRGDMSFVGPRPCLVSEFRHYPPHGLDRFRVLPGLTGLWQVSGKNRTTFMEMICLDVTYARSVSALGDVRILWRTLPAVAREVRLVVRTWWSRSHSASTRPAKPLLSASPRIGGVGPV